ncbi:DNA mismatch repair endonuclease MutL [Geofilum sp. OHC36d9]|uniref:DNA mismatch repair endonuclease MutL n=1 Tax=Geofilum sp. OHC36d9 TaxID=3458413 RepID=UPI0040343014
MADIIQLLPDSVANQIAAGEVIQRPASAIKELAENAIDAGATEIEIVIKDAGRTLIQVIDNGTGMSETDARMAFERHATSKIRQATDLFSIRTMGFRGEALASIAAVAQVELITRREESELGVHIEIAASKIEKQEPVSCPKGSNFIIRNLFYNIPARRKFLKSDTTELRHIITEVQRVALANTRVSFKLTHNNLLLMNLPAANLRQRISGMMNKSINTQLIPIDSDATVVNITGFTGKPESARKTSGDQYFFVNNRFMRHPYLHKAIVNAYENLISPDAIPTYFIFFDIDPEYIDVNIHPTKTEIKFSDEKLIWKVLNASIRESLGKFNIVPSIDFDTEGQVNIPTLNPNAEVKIPEVHFNPDYNPFNTGNNVTHNRQSAPRNWESLYNGFESEAGSEPDDFEAPETIVLPSRSNNIDMPQNNTSLNEAPEISAAYFQVKSRYILTPVKSGLMIIDQRRAHERVLYERFLNKIQTRKSTTQQLLFGEPLSFNAEETALLKDIKNDLAIFGFDIKEENNTFTVKGIPSEFENVNTAQLLENLLEAYKTGEVNPGEEVRQQLAAIMARNACMKYGETLTQEEMALLVGNLFSCQMAHYTPGGQTIISIIDNEELEKRFR